MSLLFWLATLLAAGTVLVSAGVAERTAELQALTVRELKDLLTAAGKSTKGRKAALVERMLAEVVRAQNNFAPCNNRQAGFTQLHAVRRFQMRTHPRWQQQWDLATAISQTPRSLV